MWIDRDIGQVVASLAGQRPALVLTGARQTGKTSLLRKIFADHHFVSLDLPSEAALAEASPDEFLRRHPPPVLVDEVQYAPGLFRHLKNAIDEDRHGKGRFILTGSQKFVLMRAVSDSLAGRIAVLDLETLSLHEVRRSYPAVTATDLLLRGGFPELWQDRALDALSFYRSYLATYLERDLRSVLRVTSLRDFERFIRACALRSGQLLNKSDLARDIGISGSTANEWLSALQAASQIALLEPWHQNAGKSLAKTPKLYFCDTGLLLFLLNIRDPDELFGSPLRGAVFETLVYCELRKRLGLRHELESLFFLRDRSKEVDFAVHRGGRFALYECKWTENPDATDVAGLSHFSRELGPDRVASRTLVCRTPSPFPLPGQVHAVQLEDLTV
jgi:predicted AAA+ superfamily ATPase